MSVKGICDDCTVWMNVDEIFKAPQCPQCKKFRDDFGNLVTDETLAVHRFASRAGWAPVKFAADCELCEDCGEPWCRKCEMHYADCSCVGPHQDGHEYRTFNKKMFVRKLK